MGTLTIDFSSREYLSSQHAEWTAWPFVVRLLYVLDTVLTIGSLTIRECAANDDPPEKTPGRLSTKKIVSMKEFSLENSRD